MMSKESLYSTVMALMCIAHTAKGTCVTDEHQVMTDCDLQSWTSCFIELLQLYVQCSIVTNRLSMLVLYLCVGKLVPDNCTSGRSLPCTDVTEVVVVDLPPEHQQRYRISLSYHHKPAVHYPQVSTHYCTCTEQTHFACTAHHMYTWTHHTTCTQQHSYT